MSTEVDSKVVQMSFDNKDFESNAQSSINTIESLKNSLNFEGSTRGLENVNSAISNVDVSTLDSAVETIKLKFSAMEVVAVTALANITNSAVNAGKRMLSALTIDPIRTGFQEYETQINSVQTIMANTQNVEKKASQTAINEINKSAATATATQKAAGKESISNLKKTQSAQLKEFNKNATEELKTSQKLYEEQVEMLQEAIDEEKKALKEAHDEKIALYNSEYEAKLKATNLEKYNALKAIDDEINALQGKEDTEDKVAAKKEKEENLRILQNAVNNAKTEFARADAEEELATYKKKLAKEEQAIQVANQISLLNTKRDAIENEYDAKLDSIKDEYSEKISNENESYNLQLKQNAEIAEYQKKQLKELYESEREMIQERQDNERTALREKQEAELAALEKYNETALAGIQTRASEEVKALQKAASTEVKSSSLDEVNEALDELNKYADKTIYNFTEMTRNIGTFTAAGVDLETSVKAIKGIANLGAISGSNSNQVSTAMYQLSQALASGTVKLQDWNSVVNAGMGGESFQKSLKETARAHGIAIDEMIAEEGSFRETLQKGWLSSEILLETLSKYTDTGATEEIVKLTGASEDLITQLFDVGSKAGYDSDEFKKLAKEISKGDDAIASQVMSMVQFAGTATDAATKVKTFTQLFDTLKEAAQSGWTQSWEYIVGDFEEAKTLLTEVSNVIGGYIEVQANARNAILKEWKDLGGRTALIETFKNTLSALIKIVRPVKEAFREIFPTTTGKQLASITENVKNLTAKLIISDETASKIKSTFKGLFAILDVGKQAFTAIISGVVRLGSAIAESILPLGSVFLDATSNIGDFLVKIDESIKKSEVFKNVIDKIVDFLLSIPSTLNNIFKNITGISIGDAFSNVTETISGALEKIKSLFSEFGKVDTSGISEMSSKVTTSFSPITSLFNGIKKVIDGVISFFKKLAPVFSVIAKKLGEALGQVGSTISDGVKSFNIQDLLDLVNSGVLIALGVAIKKFFDNLSSVTENAGGVIDNIKGVLNGVRGCFEAWQQNLKAKTLVAIAMAIGIISASLFVLSTIDQEQLATALAAITAEFVELIQAFKSISNVDSKGTTKAASTMILMSVAVLLLASACKKLAALKPDELLKGLAGVTILSKVLVEVAKEMSANVDKMTKGATGLIAFAIAIRLLVKPVQELAQLSMAELTKGLIGVGVLCVELSKFMNTTDLDGMGLRKGAGILLLAIAVNSLAKAVGKFAELDTSGMIKGLVAVGVVLAELSVFTNSTSGSEGMIATSTGMVILAAALNILAKDVGKFGSMSIETIAKGLIAMAGALIIISGSIQTIPKNTISIGIGLVAVGYALKMIAESVSNFGDMTWEEIAKGLIALAGSITVLAIGLNVMKGTLSGSAALLVAAGALLIMCPVLAILGNMQWETIGKGLLTIAGVFAVLGVAGYALAPVVPAILGLSAAITLLGVGVLACGVGLVTFSAGLAALCAAGTAGINMLIYTIEKIIGLIPKIATKIANGLVAMVKQIGASSGEIATSLIQIGKALIDSLNGLIPPLIELLVNILAILAENLPQILEYVMTILLELLASIADNLGPLITIVIDAIVNVLKAIANKLPDIIQAGIDIVIALIDGLGQGLVDNAARLRESLLGLCKNLLKAVLEFFGIHSPSKVFADIGLNLILGLINGIVSMTGELLNAVGELLLRVISKIGGYLVDFISKGAGLISGLVTGVLNKMTDFGEAVGDVIMDGIYTIGAFFMKIYNKGKEFIGKLSDGIKACVDTVVDTVSDLIDSVIEFLKGCFDTFVDIGSYLMEGLGEGISGAVDWVVDGISEVATGISDGFCDLLGIHSPSRLFAEFGKYIDEGLAKGLLDYSSLVNESTEKVGKTAVDSMTKSIAGISDKLNSDMDSEPVIKPVLDLTDISNGVGKIDDMLYDQKSMQIAANMQSRLDESRLLSESSLFDRLSSLAGNQTTSNTFTNTFNITGNNPQEIAEEVSNIIQSQVERRSASWA